MSEVSTKIRRTIYWLRHDILVFDNIVIIVAVIFCLAWTWGAISAMTRNWALSEELATRQREKALLELEVEMLELENTYYSSAEYQELAARKYQNKMLEGESMVYLPDNSVAAKTKRQDTATPDTIFADLPNFQQWLAFLFGV